MKSVGIIVGLLFSLLPSVAAQSPPVGDWTGGFWLDGNWVTVDVALQKEKETLSGTADIVFPSYASSVRARGVALVSLKAEASRIEFQVPFENAAIVFRGRIQGETISGTFAFKTAQGAFGMTRLASPSQDALEKYYGIYRVSPERFISISRGLADPRTLIYVDYASGQVGTLWASAQDSDFFSGPGEAISFPITLRVSFDKDAHGAIKSLAWSPTGKPTVTAHRIELKEERLTCTSGSVTLAGTLILPANRGRHPVVIVTPGDFGNYRDQLRLFAHNYVSRGIVALVFDSRGAGESTGTVNSTSFPDLADDVLAMVESLKKREDVDPRKIGVFGFSNSAWTVALAASRSKDVAFVILQSFIPSTPWRQDTFRAENQLRVDKFPEGTVKKGAEFMRLKFEVARTGKGWEQLQSIMEQARGERWLAYTNPPRSLERLRQHYLRSMTYDPLPALERLNAPVLAYWGGNDSYLPVAESVATFKQAMAKAGNRDHTATIFPKGSHDLVEGDTGSPSAGARRKRFPPGFWKTQTDWLLKRVRVSK